MSDPVSTADADRFPVQVTADSHFGWIRTRLSLERTMMSWLRTAVALIGFGFAIVQYLNHLQQIPETAVTPRRRALSEAPDTAVSLTLGPESQVRTRLPAGGREIRTAGPSQKRKCR